MYGKITNGILETTDGSYINCKLEEEGKAIFITAFNLGKEELEILGYYELSPEAEEAFGTDAVFEVRQGKICVKNEEA